MDEVAVEDAGVGAVGELAPTEVLATLEAVVEVEGVVGVGKEGEVVAEVRRWIPAFAGMTVWVLAALHVLNGLRRSSEQAGIAPLPFLVKQELTCMASVWTEATPRPFYYRTVLPIRNS